MLFFFVTISKEKEKEDDREDDDFVSSFLPGFSPSLFKSFSFPSFFHPNAFFSSQEKKS
jgi:hypothetical protein